MTKGTLWPNLEEAGSKNGENEIPVLVRGSDINLSVSAAYNLKSWLFSFL